VLAAPDLGNTSTRTDVGQTSGGQGFSINYFNADHTHALIDLPTNLSIEQAIQLLKGSSSHWINQNRLIKGRFAWGRGYGAFSVSHSDIGRVANYIANQEGHHRKRTFEDEYQMFVKKYGLEWRDEENR
jgi:putative transposase